MIDFLIIFVSILLILWATLNVYNVINLALDADLIRDGKRYLHVEGLINAIIAIIAAASCWSIL